MIQIDMPLPKSCNDCIFCFTCGIKYYPQGSSTMMVCKARYRMDELKADLCRMDYEYKYDFPEDVAFNGRQEFCPLEEARKEQE